MMAEPFDGASPADLLDAFKAGQEAAARVFDGLPEPKDDADRLMRAIDRQVAGLVGVMAAILFAQERRKRTSVKAQEQPDDPSGWRAKIREHVRSLEIIARCDWRTRIAERTGLPWKDVRAIGHELMQLADREQMGRS